MALYCIKLSFLLHCMSIFESCLLFIFLMQRGGGWDQTPELVQMMLVGPSAV